MSASSPAKTSVVVETSLGWVGVALSPVGIRYATLPHRTESAATTELRSIGSEPGGDPRAEEIARLLRAYAGGDADALMDFPVDLPPVGDSFQRAAWLKLREIPAGETRSYGWLARELNSPSGSRAAGAAMGANPIPLWLPCHRVVGSDGSLHGFGGGLAMKSRLLELEGALPQRML